MTSSTKSKSTSRKPRLSDAQLAARLAGEAGVLAFRRLAQGGMVVVNGCGQKFEYSAAEVRACRQDAG